MNTATRVPRVAIVGAGFSGLALAYRLQEIASNAHITVLESSSRPGGKAWTLHEGGFRVETGPNGFLDTKPTTLQLCRDLELEYQLVRASDAAAQHRFLFLGDRLRPLPANPLALLTSDVLSWRAKWELLSEPWRVRKRPGKEETIAEFAQRRAGPDVARVLADAMVTGIFAGDPRQLSLAACFPRLAQLEREHGSVVAGFRAAARRRREAARATGQLAERPGTMWSLTGGMRMLIETLQAKLRNPIRLNFPVDALLRHSGGDDAPWSLISGTQRVPADIVVLTTPADHQATLLQPHHPDFAELRHIHYNRLAVVALAYAGRDVPISLAGFGYLTPQRLGRAVLGTQWCSSIFPGQRAPKDSVLLRCMTRLPAGYNDDALISVARAELRKAMKVSAKPAKAWVIPWEQGIPQYEIGHLDRAWRILQAAQQLPGLFVTGNAYRGVALNDCAEQAVEVARQISRVLRKA